MDRKLRKILTECIRDIETGARDVEGCLQRHPDRAAELRPHLELWSSLNSACKAQPNFGRQQRGQYLLLAALAGRDGGDGEKRKIPVLTPALVKVIAVVAAAALLIGGAAGASAALGGPDVAGNVLSTMGINHAPEAAQNGMDSASQNAFDGSGNADDGADNANADHGTTGCPASENAGPGIDNASQTGRDNANLDPPDGPDNSGQDISNASETGSDQANPNAGDGAGNADDREGNANPNAGDGAGNAGDDDDGDIEDED